MDHRHGQVPLERKTHHHNMVNPLNDNARDLELEFEWFARVLDTRLRLYFGKECPHS